MSLFEHCMPYTFNSDKEVWSWFGREAQIKNDDSVKEAPAYCQSFLDGLPKGFVTLCDVL